MPKGYGHTLVFIVPLVAGGGLTTSGGLPVCGSRAPGAHVSPYLLAAHHGGAHGPRFLCADSQLRVITIQASPCVPETMSAVALVTVMGNRRHAA